MATHDYIISNASGAAVRADLNNALAAIATNNSSATEPTTTYAYQWWADTGSSPTVMKLRNAANSAWITLFQLDGEWTVVPFENGTAAAPSIYFKDSGTDTGIYSPGTDQVGISAGGTSRFEISTTATTSTLPVVHPLGAVGTPSITFTGDLNTGIYSPAADTIAFVEGGAEAMRIDSSGRLGIGTTSPASTLHVSGSSDQTYTFQTTTSGADNRINFRNSSGTDAGGIWYMHSGNHLLFNTGGSNAEKARIDGSGRLLVGTSSAQGNSTVTIEQTAANSAPLALRYTSTNDNQIGIDFYRSRSSSAKVESTDPIMRLDAYGYDGSAYRKGASIEAIVDAATSAGDMPCRLVFSTTADGASSPTERARLDNKGSFCLGTPGNTTASPQDVDTRTLFYNDGTSSGLYIDSRNSSSFIHVNQTFGDTANRGAIAFYRNESAKGSISVDSSQVYYNTTSDYRLKENVAPLSGALQKVEQLKPSVFNFIADPNRTVHGFIAHEVQDVVPEAVVGEKDAVDDDGNPIYQGIDQSKLVPLLTAALQEAIAKIETLEAKVAALEAA